MAIPILHEQVRGYHLLGALLVLAGVYTATQLSTRGREKGPAARGLLAEPETQHTFR